MRKQERRRLVVSRLARTAIVAGAVVAQLALAAHYAGSQTPPDSTPKVTLYGFGQADYIADFKRNDPNWFDVNRPSRLPSGPDDLGRNGHSYLSARQSRFGAKATIPTRRGDVFVNFDFDMFGVGRDAGQTTIRLRHAYGEWHGIGGGQLESAFMDLDVFPNILDYWGPNGMLFFRNVQVYWKPIDNDKMHLRIALENPGASADAGNFANRIELQNVTPRYPLPDLSAGFKYGANWGYVRVAGMLRDIRWDQVPVDTFDLSGRVTGWGTNLSSNIKFLGQDVIRLQFTYGAGIQNYFNDAPSDVGAKFNTGNLRTPLTGEALPIFGASTFIDHNWNPRVSTSLGWSMVNIDNSNAQAVTAYHNGQYAIVNLLWTPVTGVMMGGEYQYGWRKNVADGWTFADHRLQFSFKYSFSQDLGGK
ncbi:MAG TPA: DcaP family trimeric outer membrane transporter [Gemmatimonadaceae bacterium]|nr:DcaP family trimeric outer membrane transporter [Gemmatimonadaceae bacterium]